MHSAGDSALFLSFPSFHLSLTTTLYFASSKAAEPEFYLSGGLRRLVHPYSPYPRWGFSLEEQVRPRKSQETQERAEQKEQVTRVVGGRG